MGFIGTIMLLAFGFGLAWIFDTLVLRRDRPAIEVKGPALTRALKKSNTYADLRSAKKVHRPRLGDRSRSHDQSLEVSRDGRDGGRVLQIDRRRKM